MRRILKSRSLPLLLSRGMLAGLLLLPACAASGGATTETGAATAALPMGTSTFGQYLAGRHAQNERDLDSAADFMALVLADDPQNLELLQNTYLLMASEGRMAEAAELARRLEARNADISTAGLSVVLAEVSAGNLEAAKVQLAEMPSDGLSKFITPILQAWLALELEGIDPALAILAPLSEVDGFTPVYHLHAGLLNERAGRLADAEKSYRAAIDDAVQPSFRLVELLGSFYQQHGRSDEARTLYREYAAQNLGTVLIEPLLRSLESDTPPPPVVATLREGFAEALFDLATVLYQENASDLALIYTRMALDMRPQLPIAQMLLGDILIGQERIADAVEAYRDIPRSSPLHWQARLNIAECLDMLGETEEAIATLRAMSEERPDRQDAPLRLGNLLRSKERFAEAAEAYDVAVDRIAKLEPQHWSTLYFRGIARERSDQWPLAEADFLKALELEPEHPYVMNYLAYSWVEKGQNYDRALDMLRRAVDLRPQDGYIVDSLGWVLYRLGDYGKAVKYLERAVELNPTDPVINDHLGDAYWKVGRRNEARFQWTRALNFEPEAEQIPHIESKIERGLASTHASGS
ncbi:tetratricopeptide repeat protein [Rhodospirillaceae bacterium SYSU D60014]|uniref:tetratricopeptide repeat protein n=1 Tax=Virgifigura deserti TaxID=2268457 RepID=UPI0013C49409